MSCAHVFCTNKAFTRNFEYCMNAEITLYIVGSGQQNCRALYVRQTGAEVDAKHGRTCDVLTTKVYPCLRVHRLGH